MLLCFVLLGFASKSKSSGVFFFFSVVCLSCFGWGVPTKREHLINGQSTFARRKCLFDFVSKKLFCWLRGEIFGTYEVPSKLLK